MCGILVTISRVKLDSDRLKTASDLLQHRGPDHTGIATYKVGELFYTFIHTRLTIRDLSKVSNQPLSSSCGRYVLCFNGEIYNSSKLASRFDIIIDTDSDTIILLELLIRLGKDALQYIEGIFAFAFLDIYTGDVLISRDSLGVKPLYFYHDENALVYSSEISSLKVMIDGVLMVDAADIFEFLSLGFVSEPNTGFQQVKKVKPSWSHLITSQLCVKEEEFKYLLSDEHGDEENIIKEAFRDQTVSDVPVGIFFSGGIDSALLALEIDLPLLHLEANKLDSKYSKKIADFLDREIINIPLDSSGDRDIIEDAEFIARHLEEPISDYTFIASYYLSVCARKKGYKVMLSGMGADEIFGGYPRYKVYRLYLALKPLISFFGIYFLQKLRLFSVFRGKRTQRLLSSLTENDPYWSYAALVGYFSRAEIMKLWKKDTYDFDHIVRQRWVNLVEVNESYEKLPRAMDRHGYLSHNLLVADKSSMLAGLELRVPYLSEKVFYMFSKSLQAIPRSKKQILDWCEKKIPSSFMRRKKEGFNPPLTNLVSSKTIQEYESYFELSGMFEYLQRDQVHEILLLHYSGYEDNTYKIWQLVFFSAWLKRWCS